MKTLNLTINVTAVQNAFIEVPDNMSFEEAMKYTEKHLDKCVIVSALEMIPGTEVLDEDNCDFDE